MSVAQKLVALRMMTREDRQKLSRNKTEHNYLDREGHLVYESGLSSQVFCSFFVYNLCFPLMSLSPLLMRPLAQARDGRLHDGRARVAPSGRASLDESPDLTLQNLAGVFAMSRAGFFSKFGIFSHQVFNFSEVRGKLALAVLTAT